MGSEWREVSVEDLAAREPNALATGPFGSAISSKHFTDRGIPVIRGSNLSTNISERLIDDGIVYVSKEKAKEFHRSIARRGDLVFTCWGTINQIGYIDARSRYDEYIVSNKQMKLTVDRSKVYPLFLYYLFSSPEKQAEILDNGIGSSVPGFNLGQLRNHRVPLPSLPEQQQITGILSSLDDKIALLRETNATLEAIAQAIFKSWFVDFDPVRAKAEGREPEGVPPEVADLFPNEFEDSELGAIPKGWRVVRIRDLLELAYGKALKATDRTPGEVPVYGSGGINGTHNRALIDHPTVIVGRKGTVGSLYWEDLPCFPIDTVFFVNPILASLEFCFRVLQVQPLREMNTDAAVPGLNRENVYRLKVCFPPKSIAEAFDNIVGSLRNRMQAVRIEIEGLSDLRDTLLPRLMSGKLRISETEEALA